MMRRGSLAQLLPAALLALTALLAVLAALGVASLYAGRQAYEVRLAETYALEVGAAGALVSAVAVEAGLRTRASRADLRRAAAGFGRAAGEVLVRAQDDAASRALARPIASARRRVAAAAGGGPVARRRALRAIARVRGAVAALAERQAARRAQARDDVRAASRRSLLAIVLAGALALAGVLGFLTLLVRGLRSPLDALVDATARLASGDLDVRVRPDGPRELRDLGTAFNAMAERLAAATQRLRTERERLATTIESLGDALLLTDGDGVVTLANPRAGDLLPQLEPGVPAHAAGTPLPDLEDALHREVVVERGDEVLAVTAARLAGDDDAVVWTARDVSERARLERAKSEFVATASHELRSPLTSIKGFLELLQQPANGELTPRQRRFVDVIVTSANRLVDLVDDLLDVARIEAGQFRLSRRPADLRPVVEEVVALLEPRLADKRQRLVTELPEQAVPAFADPARIRQVLVNLVTNAHLYTPAGGEIAVALRPSSGGTVLEVRDTGRGMSRQDLARVFDRFFRSPEVDRREPGTGLGLAIVKSLVDLHGGSIEVDSEPGEGTTFRIALPGVPAVHRAPGRELLRGRRVLVVEDEEPIAELVRHHLAEADVDTEWAPSGDAALRALRDGDFDAVTLDVLMPGMSGIEVLQRIRADPALRSTAVVFVSVAADESALEGEWVVPKPIDPLQLTDLVARAVRSRRSRVLVMGGEAARSQLSVVLDALGVEQRWCSDASSAARLAARERFEVALVDAGLPDARAAVRDLELQGRRQGRALLAFTTVPGQEGAPVGVPLMPVARAVTVLQEVLASGDGRGRAPGGV